MAQTKKKRTRKKRGTQAGKVDSSKRSRPRTRAEARNQAKSGGRNRSMQKGDNPPTWKGASVRGLIAAGVFVILLILIFGAGGYYLRESRKKEPTYRTEDVSRGNVRATVTATGTVNAVTTVQVGTQVSGTIKGIYVDFNAPVKKGELLAQIDPAIFEAQVQQLIDGRWRHTDVLNFWMLDGGKWCECQACKNQGTYTDRLMIVVDQMLRAIKTALTEGRLQRDVALATLAYHETLAPPTKPLPQGFDYDNCSVTYFPIERCYAHAIADPTCTEVNRLLHEAYQGWTTGAGRHYTGSIFIGEYYNVSGLKSLPVLFTKIMAADIPWYWRTGARHFHYMHTPTRLWGTWTLNQHMMARLLWDIHTDVDQLLDEYFARFYPTTTEQTRAFYRELEFAMANIKAIKHYVRTPTGTYSLRLQLGASSRELLPLDHLQYKAHHPVLNDGPDWVEIIAAMDRARRLIDDTMLTCDDKHELARLMEDERRFAYGEAMMRLYYHLTRAVICHRTGDRERARLAFVQVERQAKILEGVDELVQVASSHANAKNGVEAAAVKDIYEWLRKAYGASQPASE